jgi:hypothetical protein
MARAARTNSWAPGVVVAAADSSDRLNGTAAVMLEAQEDLSEKTWAERSPSAVVPELSRRMWRRAEA